MAFKGRSPLLPISQNVMLEAAKKEVTSSSNAPSCGTVDGTSSYNFHEAFMEEFASLTSSSPPIFSMDALTDVLGDYLDSQEEGQEGQRPNQSDDINIKFNLEEISMIEQNADSMATALFNATQGTGPSTLQDELQSQCFNLDSFQGGNTQLNLNVPISSLPQLEHPLFDSIVSPASSSQCSSPIYTRIQNILRGKSEGYEGGVGSSDSNPGSECSDSDFELEGDSSPCSDDTSDTEFDADDSDSDYGAARKRRNTGYGTGIRKPPKRGFGKSYGGATRKQPYHHHKNSKNKDVELLMGGSKPLARQISTHQLEAIAATMGSSPVTVNWLIQNYETSEGNSLPRALMYGHYLRHCAELRLDPVNAASFGKLIRSVFVGLTTRRLGTRGNSKYHYCGIRIKDTSLLLLEDPDLSKKTRTNGKRSKKTQILAMQGVGICGLGGNKGLTLELDAEGNIDVQAVKKYMGQRCSDFPEIALSEFYVPDGISCQDLMYFTDVYKKHCWDVLSAVEEFQLNDVPAIITSFWKDRAETNAEDPLGISKENLLILVSVSEVQFAVQNLDAFMYDQILSILMPNVICQLPFQLLEEYQKFSLTLHSTLESALSDYDPGFIALKLQILDSFVNELKAWISLNLSAQAARDSMQSPNSIAQLLSDLNRINFRSVLMDVKEYVKVDEMDINVHESLKRILSGPDSIEPWSAWLVGLVEQRIGASASVGEAHDAQSTVSAVIKECRDLNLQWLKYMSQLKLELLLRSSGSLATFLSLELLFSNFLLHLIKVYKSRALQVPLVLYSIVRQNRTEGEEEVRHFEINQIKKEMNNEEQAKAGSENTLGVTGQAETGQSYNTQMSNEDSTTGAEEMITLEAVKNEAPDYFL